MKARTFFRYVAVWLLIASLYGCKASEVLDMNLLDCAPFSVDVYRIKSCDIRMGFFVTFYFDRKGRLINYQYTYITIVGKENRFEQESHFDPSGNYQYPDSVMKYINIAEPYIPLMQMVHRGCRAKLHKVNMWQTAISFVPRVSYQPSGNELYKYQDYWKKNRRDRK